MDSPFDNVKDSSIWYKPSTLRAVTSLDNRIYFGIVREALNDKNTNELRYMVEIHYKNDIILSNCRMIRSFGGVFNYEDFVLQGYNYNAATNSQNGFAAYAGDIVLVGQLGGQGREGVILGGLTHLARKSFLDATKGPQYRSEFNGIETYINEDGEYTLTFKGQPTNLNKLASTPDKVIPEPEYDKDVGTSFLKWDKMGSFTLSDNATDSDGIQKLFVDKKNGFIEIDSGKISLVLTKKNQSVVLTSKTTEISSSDMITFKTKAFETNANDHVTYSTQTYTVKAQKVFLGSDSLLTAGVPNDGVVTGVGIDTFTGQPYSALGNASSVVFAKK